jgi:pimeloyl-ACP methyl ester carboxylesterase
VRQVIYLHGFGSSPDSTKARYFAERLGPLGVSTLCPDLNGPDFSTLTTTRMVEQVERLMAEIPAGPVAVIGSSLGGFAGLHVAARQAARIARGAHPRCPVDRLVLLAPALDFGRSGFTGIDDVALDEWRRTDQLEVMHWALNEKRIVHYGLYEDALRYDSFAERVAAPTLIFQGRNDTVVEPAMVQRFAGGRPAVSLRLLDDDHLLALNLELMWGETSRFLGLPGLAPDGATGPRD